MNAEISEAQAKAIVKAIIADLSGRKGIGDEWDQIDSDIKREIKAEWIRLVIGKDD